MVPIDDVLGRLRRWPHRYRSAPLTSNSSTSLIAIAKTWSVNEPSAEVARTVMLRLAPSASRSIAAGHRDHAGAGVDREPAAVVVLQRIGDRVVGRIVITGRRGDADHRADCGVLVDRVGRRISIGHRADIELVDIVDVDREYLVGERLPSLTSPAR